VAEPCSFPQYLEARRFEVEARLESFFARAATTLSPHGPDVRACVSALQALTLRGGKRLRAALVRLGWDGVAPTEDASPAEAIGAAYELLQTYLLVQDDWMDQDALRRGGPSAHTLLAAHAGDAHLGATYAVLASDLCWGWAVRSVVEAKLPAPRAVAAVSALLRTHEEVVVGQVLDTSGRAPDVEAMHRLKTGSYTVEGPLVLGASAAGAAPHVLDALRAYAAPLGLAFQLRDDLLGTFGDPGDTGKPAGNDLRRAKRTAVVEAAERLLGPRARASLDAVVGAADDDPAVARVIEELRVAGVESAVQKRLDDLVEQGIALAAVVPFDEAARAQLVGFAQLLARRAH
jgi:geranylgeranyl diphosphate synthase type I